MDVRGRTHCRVEGMLAGAVGKRTALGVELTEVSWSRLHFCAPPQISSTPDGRGPKCTRVDRS